MLPIRSLDLVDSNITQTLTGWTYFLHFPVTGRVARAFSGVFYKGSKDFVEALKVINPHNNGNICLGGDLNLPHVDWDNLSATPGYSCISQTETLIHAVNDQSLTQVIIWAMSKNNLIDLFFTSRASLVNQCGCIHLQGRPTKI